MERRWFRLPLAPFRVTDSYPAISGSSIAWTSITSFQVDDPGSNPGYRIRGDKINCIYSTFNGECILYDGLFEMLGCDEEGFCICEEDPDPTILCEDFEER